MCILHIERLHLASRWTSQCFITHGQVWCQFNNAGEMGIFGWFEQDSNKYPRFGMERQPAPVSIALSRTPLNNITSWNYIRRRLRLKTHRFVELDVTITLI